MKRLLFVDNLRIFLIALVILHHLLITYGGPGGWYYTEITIEGPEMLPYAMFLATNQSFFMAMFFMISAFFMVPSLRKKGPRVFVRDRLIRLGIPLVVFYFLLNPLTNFLISKVRDGIDMNFFQYWWEVRPFGFGPMWFVEALLLFSLAYVARVAISGPGKSHPVQSKLPSPWAVVALAVMLGILTFIVRIWLPVGWVFDPLGFQFPHFVQYIALFVIGILAYQNGWFEQITYRIGIRWFVLAQVLVFIVFPGMFILGGAAETGPSAFMGGFTWQSLAYAVWEQLNGFALIIGLSGIFKQKFNSQNKLAQRMSASAYTAYVIHTPLLVYLTLMLTNLILYPAVKFIVVAPIALIVIFFVADVIRRLPLARKIM